MVGDFKILTMLEIKGQVLHRVRVHLKIPGWLLDLNALLTRKLPMFWSHLNEKSGDKGNIYLVSGSKVLPQATYADQAIKNKFKLVCLRCLFLYFR